MQLQSRSDMAWMTRVLLLALAYVIAGRLALLLAIPPGFATAIFPPVGIALAAVLIWGYPLLLGVFIGSTVLNLSISVDGLAQLDPGHLWIACGIAFGTTLQCLTASWLIRRLLGFPNPLVDERSIFMLLLLGGPRIDHALALELGDGQAMFVRPPGSRGSLTYFPSCSSTSSKHLSKFSFTAPRP